MLTDRIDVFSTKFIWLPIILTRQWWPDDVLQNGRWHNTIIRGTGVKADVFVHLSTCVLLSTSIYGYICQTQIFCIDQWRKYVTKIWPSQFINYLWPWNEMQTIKRNSNELDVVGIVSHHYQWRYNFSTKSTLLGNVWIAHNTIILLILLLIIIFFLTIRQFEFDRIYFCYAFCIFIHGKNG